MRIVLTRYGSSPAGTPGTWEVYDDEGTAPLFKCYATEQPWLFNATFISCIPIGEYTIRLDRFNKGGYAAYEVDRVRGRSEIKIHIANDITNLEGCIALGLTLAIKKGLWYVGSSTKAYERFMEVMDGARLAVLEVKNAYPIQEGELYEVQ